MRANLSEAVPISPLQGDQISAQGFNPGLGNSRHVPRKGTRIRRVTTDRNHALGPLHSRATFRAHIWVLDTQG